MGQDKTYITAEQLRRLGARWKPAPSGEKNALVRWGIVGLLPTADRTRFHHRHDHFSLSESFRFCADHNIAIPSSPEARLINADQRQGGLDFMIHDQPLDAAILSWIYEPDPKKPPKKGDIYFVSPHYKGPESWGKAAERLGVKILFIVGATKTELGTKQFQYEGSPYRVLKEIVPSQNFNPALGVVIHKDYAQALGIKIPISQPVTRAVAELQGNDIRL